MRTENHTKTMEKLQDLSCDLRKLGAEMDKISSLHKLWADALASGKFRCANMTVEGAKFHPSISDNDLYDDETELFNEASKAFATTMIQLLERQAQHLLKEMRDLA